MIITISHTLKYIITTVFFKFYQIMNKRRAYKMTLEHSSLN